MRASNSKATATQCRRAWRVRRWSVGEDDGSLALAAIVGALAGSWPVFILAAVVLMVIGDVILDRYVWGDAARVSPEAPVVVLRADHDEVRLEGRASAHSGVSG
ncbi:MAG TPA: hypothetical protein VMV69_21785 [Pirellulales bacterium]|nr:hypothetical protein [Pirellulales bacterium]